MSEARMAMQMGRINPVTHLQIRRSTDEGYHGLTRDVKRRVKRGDIVVLGQEGEVINVLDREELRKQRDCVPQILFNEEPKVLGTETLSQRIVDVTGENRITARLAADLNGDSLRARKLVENKVRELAATGAISQAEIIRHEDRARPPIYGVQTGDIDTKKRVKAYFSKVGEDFVLRVVCRVRDDEKGRRVLENDGYLPQKIGRGSRRG